MNKQDLVDLLQKDMKNEYKHHLFYLHSAVVVRGLHREELQEFFLKAASSEMNHIIEFGETIIGLGGTVSIPGSGFFDSLPLYLIQPKDILAFAVEMEDEVVSNYVTRAKQAEEFGGPNGYWVQVFMEKQIEDSRRDADHMRMMLQ
jgi:bacterioferritin (cytochrome b1)